MRMYIGGRGFGKTTKLIRESALTGAIIACFSTSECGRILKQAKILKLEIPKPVIYEEILYERSSSNRTQKYLIDEIDSFISRVTPGEIVGYTLTPMSVEHLPMPEELKKRKEELCEGKY